MDHRSLASPEDQSVTFVELFFDLVFVFSVTQIVGILHDGITGLVIVRAVLAFWLVWWAWTQFTWALNAANTDHPRVQTSTLIATAVAFFLAVGVPNAFTEKALWFAVPYVAVRLLGLLLYHWVATANPEQQRAVRLFGTLSLGGLVAVLLGAFLGGDAQYWLWAFAIFLDIVAASVGGQAEGWGLHAGHFAERHGLIVIIALGESLIVAAGGITGGSYDPRGIGVALLGVVLTSLLWWSYFPYVKPTLERALHDQRGQEQSSMARDAFSLAHFPMLCGIIAYAAALEEAIAHPDHALPPPARLALAVGLALFLMGAAAATWRARLGLPLVRTVGTAITVAAVLGTGGVAPGLTLALALGGVAVTVALEQRRAVAGEAERSAHH